MIVGNNPGNIRRVQSITWVGEIKPNPWVPGFVTFDSLEHGYRAMFVILNNYIGNGFNTIEKIVTRWAPPSENDTANYINFVSEYTHIKPGMVIEKNSAALADIVQAMSEIEHSGALTSGDIAALNLAREKLAIATPQAQTASFAGWGMGILTFLILLGLAAKKK